MNSKRHKITIEIVRAVLENQNGYTMQEIIDKNLAEECEGSCLWDDITMILVENNIK